MNKAYLDTLLKINRVFDYINTEIFGGELPNVLFTIEPDKKKGKVAGWFQSKTFYRFNEKQIGQKTWHSILMKKNRSASTRRAGRLYNEQ